MRSPFGPRWPAAERQRREGAVYRGEVPASFSREMGYTRREFLANLETAMKGTEYHVREDGNVRIPLDAGYVDIRLGPDGNRVIASLALPRLEVDFRFTGVDAATRRDFYEAFQRSFQKGGG